MSLYHNPDIHAPGDGCVWCNPVMSVAKERSNGTEYTECTECGRILEVNAMCPDCQQEKTSEDIICRCGHRQFFVNINGINGLFIIMECAKCGTKYYDGE